MTDPLSKTVSVFGLGYVGCVSISCLAKAGHSVVGVDINASKVNLINQGLATIVEPGLDELLKSGFSAGAIRATTDYADAIQHSDVVLITVGTPSLPNGDLDLSHIYVVAEQIGRVLKDSTRFITVAIRSTVKPGTCAAVAKIIEDLSGKISGSDFSIVANPEFLREGSAIADYENPPYIVIGASDVKGAAEVATLYAKLGAETLTVKPQSAELIKYVNNSWHALKVAFGNEIGSVCKSLGVDSHEVMDLFFRDRTLNISSHYLRPGYAFGGACLPKDLSALFSLARANGVSAPLINSVKASNDSHIERAIRMILKHPKSTRLGFLGLSFKSGTDDVRNSPTLEIISVLRGYGYSIRVYDDFVMLALSSGRNAATTRALLKDVETLMVETSDELLECSDAIVLAKLDLTYGPILNNLGDRPLLDLVHWRGLNSSTTLYEGLSW